MPKLKLTYFDFTADSENQPDSPSRLAGSPSRTIASLLPIGRLVNRTQDMIAFPRLVAGRFAEAENCSTKSSRYRPLILIWSRSCALISD
jgi:hypothetical protein